MQSDIKGAPSERDLTMTFNIPGAAKRIALAALLGVSAALSGCYEPSAPTDVLTKETASRFLHQATFGATEAEINRLMSLGYEGWMNDQYTKAGADTYWDYIDRGGPPSCDFCAASVPIEEAFWFQVFNGQDQLRQRTAFALSQIFVISGANNSVLLDQNISQAGFQTMLMANAMGNFRDILEKVTLHPAMGVYLSHIQNEKEDPSTGRLPDENYAREVMQLFTIGKWVLNQDATRKKDANGQDIPAYSQADIMGLAKVLTGWSYGGSDTSDARWLGENVGALTTRRWDLPMQPFPNRHSTSEKRIVNGVVIPANTPAKESLKIALDTLFNHPNLPPFIASQLIKRFVTSNPSPEYVRRVANVFMENNQGIRGDMRSTVRAILFDPEARDIAKVNDPNWGKLREPVIRVANYFRAFQSKTPDSAYFFGALQTPPFDLGQTPWSAPNVFNFYQPDYQPPGPLATQNITAPEFQILDESSSAGYVNFMERGIEYYFGAADNKPVPNYSAELAVASNPTALVSRIAMLLNGGYMSADTRTLIENSVKSIDMAASDGAQRRVHTAIVLTMASPDYLIQK